MAAQKYDSSKKKVGRPRKKKDIRKLVIAMALANLGWGYTKIRDALRTGLKIEIGRTTVANILLEEGIEPAPEREKKRTWKQFMKSHWDTLYACDFFSVGNEGRSSLGAKQCVLWCFAPMRNARSCMRDVPHLCGSCGQKTRECFRAWLPYSVLTKWPWRPGQSMVPSGRLWARRPGSFLSRRKVL
jgi:hypothetical protein